MTEREIFTAAIDLPTAAARAAYIEAACGGDRGLRERVESLLRSHEEAGSFLGAPAVPRPGADDGATRAFEPGTDPDAEARAGSTGRAPSESDGEVLSLLGPATRPDSLGRVGHYEVLQVLGRGGFGTVFRAFDEMLHRVVAVKVMAPQMAATSPARKRFLREARTSAQVRHENVVQVYEVGEHPLPYLVMEFIPGETLQQRLDRVGPVDVAEVVRVGRQVAEGLAAAHATDLIHRDIKPGNILLEGGQQQRVKITDFGLARAADDASLSQSGVIAGTPMYMAPEQALGHALDRRADLFSLGSVLYQMVAGRPPFRANGTLAVLKRVAEDDPRPIREIIPETPQWLCDVIAKLHAKDPADRFQSAREVADLLADCEAQLKANSRLTDVSRIPRKRGRGSGRWAWVAVVTLLPALALALTEASGVTHLTRAERPVAGSGTSAPATAPPDSTPPGVTTKEPPSAAPSFPDAEVKRIAALPVAEQVEEVRKALMRRNPDFDGTLNAVVTGDAVTGLELSSQHVRDVSPVRAFTRLESLDCRGGAGHVPGLLADLAPLKGLPLRTLHVSLTAVSDLTPLKGMPLTRLYADNTPVADLSPLAGTALTELNCSYTRTASLAPLKGMPLSVLWCNNTDVDDLGPLRGMQLEGITFQATRVRDVSPLRGMPLTRVYLDYDARRDRELLRSLATLQTINDKNAADFLSEAEKP